MDLEKYIHSDFRKSAYCIGLADNLHHEVKANMTKLAWNGKLGNLSARVVSPFVGVGTLLASLCLRIGSIVEPIIGILADIGATIIFCSIRPLVNILFRVGHIFRNLFFTPKRIVGDVIKVGLVAGIGGIIAPESAYDNLSPYIVSHTTQLTL